METNNDAVSVAPHLHTIVEENERVRILEVVVKPGDSAEMHSHPDNVIVVLKGGILEMTNREGVARMVELKTGASFFSPTTEHAVENNSESEVHVIQIELK